MPLSTSKRAALVITLIFPAILLLILPFYTPGDVPFVLLMVGRFHPVILHFPIVLIILVLILELLRKFKVMKIAEFVITIILITAAVSTVVAIASGYLLYASGDYSGPLMRQHLWIGVLTGVCILLTTAFYFISHNAIPLYPLYVAGLLISNGAVAYTSHLGGSITHGENYLTEYLPMIGVKQDTVSIKPDTAMLVYEDLLMPVFEAKCFGCHNDSRSKGELSMVSFQHILKGGESGKPGIVAGLPDSSELYRRLILPVEDEDRMPPKGKTPLTHTETVLFKSWIQKGASLSMRAMELQNDSATNTMLSEILPSLKRYRRKQQIARIRDEQLQRSLDSVARQLNISIRKDTSSEDNLYIVAMKFPPARLTNDQFRELAPFAGVFSKMSLVSSGIEDDGLYHISRMVNLKELYLQKTNLDGSGIIYLKNLQQLEVLNLSYTRIDDKAVLELLNIPNLREVYLFQTRASADVIKALQEYKPGLKIFMEEGPYL
ncbi:MAG TPA: c-type cytochrome domain-containing protein [Flavitalea sp.]|nr:c-type cytochrome domain-containing protein [Flavitalea sp.]